MDEQDEFCWNCHEKETTIKCTNCNRCFHAHCLDSSSVERHMDWGFCDICFEIESLTNTPEEVARIPVIIRLLMNSKFDRNFFQHSRKSKSRKSMNLTQLVGDESMTKSISKTEFINAIANRIKEKTNSYKSFQELLGDVEQLVHKCVVLLTENHKKTQQAKNLLEAFNFEIDSVKKCIQCHINASNKETRTNWFKMVCDKPHLIIWAPRPYSRYWPAKVMTTTEREVYVRFFGGFHLNTNVAVQKCFLYSKDTPGVAKFLPWKTPGPNIDYTKALKEADEYITNLCAKFGSFNYVKHRTPFNPMLLDTYICEIIGNTMESPGNSEYYQIPSKTIPDRLNQTEENITTLRNVFEKVDSSDGQLNTLVSLGPRLKRPDVIRRVTLQQPSPPQQQQKQQRKSLRQQTLQPKQHHPSNMTSCISKYVTSSYLIRERSKIRPTMWINPTLLDAAKSSSRTQVLFTSNSDLHKTTSNTSVTQTAITSTLVRPSAINSVDDSDVIDGLTECDSEENPSNLDHVEDTQSSRCTVVSNENAIEDIKFEEGVNSDDEIMTTYVPNDILNHIKQNTEKMPELNDFDHDDIEPNESTVDSNGNTIKENAQSSDEVHDEMQTVEENSDEYEEERPHQSSTTPIELESIDIQIEKVVENYGEPSAKRFAFGSDVPVAMQSTNITPNSMQRESHVNKNSGQPSDHIQQLINVANVFAKLEEDLKAANATIDLMKKRDEEITHECEEMKKQLQDINDSYKQNINELKEQHAKELFIKDQDRKSAIEQAKMNKYCLACDKYKKLDIYYCDINCNRNFWERTANSKEQL